MAHDLEGKVFLVTGATEGIGKAAALDFAKRGATLSLVGRSKEKGERVVREIEAASGNKSVELLLGDLSKITDIKEIISKVVSKVPDAQVMADLDATVAWAKKSGKGDTAKLGIPAWVTTTPFGCPVEPDV